MGSISLVHPAVWTILTAIVLPLVGVIMSFLIYWIRLMDQRVVGLCRSVARIESRLGISPFSRALKKAGVFGVSCCDTRRLIFCFQPLPGRT